MSLNFDISKIENNQQLKRFGYYNDDQQFVLYAADEEIPTDAPWQLDKTVECLVWISILAGFNKITVDNWPEVFIRVAMVETCIGAYRRNSEGDAVYFKPEEVKRCIGLTTNVVALSKTKFDAAVARLVRRPCEDTLNKYRNSLEAENDEVQATIKTETETPAAV